MYCIQYVLTIIDSLCDFKQKDTYETNFTIG